MRRTHSMALLVCSLAVSLAADDHQTARVEIGAGATLEILGRSPDLGVIIDSDEDTFVGLEEPELGVTRQGNAEMIKFPETRTLWARVSQSAVASGGEDIAITMVRAVAQPGFLLYNNLDVPMEVRMRVTVPGTFLGESEPNLFFWRSSIDDNDSEWSRAIIDISILGGERVSDVPLHIVDVDRETRPTAGPSPGTPRGPSSFEVFGVPFRRDYSVTIPPARTFRRDGAFLALEGDAIALRVFTEGHVLSALPSGFPLTFVDPDLCPAKPPREIVPLTPKIRDRSCNVSRAGGASRACSCVSDDALPSQRCAYTFPDLFITLQLSAPVLAGESVDAEWTILPWATEGEYWLVPELWDGRKWIPLDAKAKLGSKLAKGKESKAKLTFTMPPTPVLLRTHVFHQPKGAKSPIESQLDASIALRLPKGQ